jgi:glycopeptide antibiotics resistance protein/uncharacterized membrane protein YozB (DUF420 family)
MATVLEQVNAPAAAEQAEGDVHALETGRRLTLAVLGYYLAVVAVITLVPFRFVVPEQLAWKPVIDGTDFLGNVLLFLPFGFLYRLSRRASGGSESARALVVGLLASAAVECTQLFEPERYPSHLDIIANALGAWAGALLCAAALRRIRAPDALVGRLSLELPLMGLLYLLVPLLWVGSLAIGDNTLRLGMLALPVVFGATLLGLVQRHHFGPAGAVSKTGMAKVAAGGVLVGAFPALVRAPAGITLLAILAAMIVLRHAGRATAHDERRFELPALRTALPFYVTYLMACALAPLTEPGGALGLGGAEDATLRPLEILRLLNAAAAFTLLGYMVAELKAREELPPAAAVRRIIAWSAPAALATRVVGDLALGPGTASWAPGAGILWVALTVGAALYGGWLYHLQRTHVRALVGVSPTHAAPPSLAFLP